MTTSAAPLEIRFLPDFKGEETVLIHGNQPALSRFADLLAEVGSQQPRSVSLQSHGWVTQHQLSLVLRIAAEDAGVSRLHSTWDWACKPGTWVTHSAQVRALSAVSLGHAFLDTAGQRFQVLVSCNEYQGTFSRDQSDA